MAEPTVADIMDPDPATVSPSTDVTALIGLPHYLELFGGVVFLDALDGLTRTGE